MTTDREAVGPAERIHVRRLDVVDTLRWSWYALTDHLELVALAFAVQLLSVASTFGISRESSTDVPAVADWVWGAYVAYFLASAVAWGVFYLTAEDAVAERSRSLRTRLVAAATRLPALIGVALLMWSPVAIGVVSTWLVPTDSVLLLILIVLAIPGVYLFFRLVLAYPACVVDREGPLTSLRTSWRIAGGNVWKILGVSLAYVALTFGFGFVSSFFGGPYNTLSNVVSAVFASLFVPLFGLALGHLYLEGSRNE